MPISRRRLLEWLAAFAAYPANAQESRAGDKAASSDGSAVEHEISSAGLSVGLTGKGHVIKLNLGASRLDIPFHACTVLTACQPEEATGHRALPGGGVEFSRIYVHGQSLDKCTVTEKFLPT